jgi:hypothetical protein
LLCFYLALQVLTATPNHIVYIAEAARSGPKAKAATAASFAERLPLFVSDVKVGDNLFVQPPNGTAVTTSAVVDIASVMLPTAHAVHTLRGNTLVDGIAASNFGNYLQLSAKDSETTRHAAAAKARLMWHAAPGLVRRLDSWGLLYPLTAALKAAGSQADALAGSDWGGALRAVGSAASCGFNAMPAVLEALLVADAGFPGEVL